VTINDAAAINSSISNQSLTVTAPRVARGGERRHAHGDADDDDDCTFPSRARRRRAVRVVSAAHNDGVGARFTINGAHGARLSRALHRRARARVCAGRTNEFGAIAPRATGAEFKRAGARVRR